MAVVNSSRFNLKEGIDKAIIKYLEEYSEEVMHATEHIIGDLAKDSVKKLKAESPKRKGSSKHEYSKGWTYELDKKRLSVGATIYGKKGTYNLAHLLEHGHAVRSGGRTVGKASAYPHIANVEQWAIKEFTERLERELGG